MKTVQIQFTRREYDLLPEGFPAQLVEGCLVRSPSPTYGHQAIVNRLQAALFGQFAVDCIRPAPMDVILDEHNVYQPDVLVFREPPPDEGRGEVLPLICFEVLSPSTACRDRETKLPHLLAAGVREVWLLDPQQRTIEVHDEAGARIVREEEPIRSRTPPTFRLTPADLYG